MNESIRNLKKLMSLAERACSQHQARLNKIETTSVSGKKPDILDPRNLVVDRFDGKKEEFDKWRKSVDLYVSRFFPECDEAIKLMRRCSIPAEMRDSDNALAAARIEKEALAWSFEQLNRDAGKWLKSKMGPEPTAAVAAVGESFINIYAQLS